MGDSPEFSLKVRLADLLHAKALLTLAAIIVLTQIYFIRSKSPSGRNSPGDGAA